MCEELRDSLFMYRKLFQTLVLNSLVIFVILLAWTMHSNVLLHPDVSWLLEASKRMFSGGTYLTDFFENNPPWILYVYTFPVALSKIFAINIILSMKLFVFGMAIVSLILCNYLLKRIFPLHNHFVLRGSLIVLLSGILLILPLNDFGQREHLFFMLIMPYLLMMTLRLQGQPILLPLAIIIGFLAGSVLLIKPYFLMTFALVEGYYLFNKRNLKFLIRPETIILALLLLSYASLLYFRHLDYLKIVMPFAYRWGIFGLWVRSWSEILSDPKIITCFFSILFFILSYEIIIYRQLTIILALGEVGFLFSHLVQRNMYSYHILPAFSMAMFLSLVVLYQYIKADNIKRYIHCLMGLLAILMLWHLSHYFYIVSHQVIQIPAVFFIFISVIFLMVLCFFSHKIVSLSNSVIICFPLLVGLLFFYSISIILPWSMWDVVGTALVMLLSFAALCPVSLREKAYCFFISCFAILLFLCPFYIIIYFYHFEKISAKSYEKLIFFVEQNMSNQSVYFFTTNIFHPYPIIHYSEGVVSASRFSSFCWNIPGLVKRSFFQMSDQLRAQQIRDKKYFIDLIVEDLVSKKPTYIFVDVNDRKNELMFYGVSKKVQDALLANFKLPFYPYISFNYLKYFSDHSQFNNEWRNFHFFKSLTGYADLPINPFAYHYHIVHDHILNDQDIKLNNMYISVLKNGDVEFSLLNNHNQINRLLMKAGDDMKEDQWLVLRNSLSSSKKLDLRAKQIIFSWLAKQHLRYQYYKFDIYKRIN